MVSKGADVCARRRTNCLPLGGGIGEPQRSSGSGHCRSGPGTRREEPADVQMAARCPALNMRKNNHGR
jgi:hypothetical protein